MPINTLKKRQQPRHFLGNYIIIVHSINLIKKCEQQASNFTLSWHFLDLPYKLNKERGSGNGKVERWASLSKIVREAFCLIFCLITLTVTNEIELVYHSQSEHFLGLNSLNTSHSSKKGCKWIC